MYGRFSRNVHAFLQAFNSFSKATLDSIYSPINNDHVHYFGLEVIFETKAKSLLIITEYSAFCSAHRALGRRKCVEFKIRQICQWPW